MLNFQDIVMRNMEGKLGMTFLHKLINLKDTLDFEQSFIHNNFVLIY